jgi:pimeloyl-ACP methyl ester carboxylesterase
MTALGWRRLRDGDSRSIVIGIDFGLGRTEAGLPELSRRLDGDYLLWETLFPAPERESDRSVETDPDRWAETVRDHLDAEGLHLAGVIGYCAGAALAFKLAERAAAGGRVPGVVLVDPETAGIHAIEDRFHSSFLEWSHYAEPGILDQAAPQRVRQAAARAERLAPDDTGHYVSLLEVVCAEYEAACAALGQSMGLDTEVTDDMSARMRAFSSYLVTSARVTPSELQAMSRRLDHVSLVSAAHEIPDILLSTEVVRFTASRDDLLESMEVATWIDRVLAGWSDVVAESP